MRLLTLIHRYLGIALALPVLAMALSGAGLVFKESIWRLQYPQLAVPLSPSASGDHARAMGEILARHPGALRFIQWPQPGLNAYQLWFDDGSRAFLEPTTLRAIDRWQWHESAVGILETVHFTLLAGHTGETVAGYVGLASVFMVFTGVILWWPARRQSLFKGLWPGRFHRGVLIRSHRHWGVLVTPLLLVILLAGTGVAFYGPVSAALSRLFDSPPPATPEVAPGNPAAGAPAVHAAIDNARARFPDARIIFFYPPGPQTPLIKVRLRQPGEPHPSGSTFVYTHARTGEMLGARDALNAPPAHKIANSLYPVHAAKLVPFVTKPLTILAGLVLGLMAVTGLLAYGRHLITSARRESV